MKAAIALCAALAAAIPARAERRVALLVGENAGDAEDPPLDYAESDAAAMRRVLLELGNVSDDDAVLLRGATAPDLRRALATLDARALGKSDQLIVYVSAHAGDGELHLRGTRFPIAELRHFIDTSGAGVVLLFVDTCHAGVAMRAKGLTPLSSRVVKVEASELKGRIVIASAGPDQSAFESQELGGSLFTQHLIAGLRGAADVGHRGKITLQDAYRYAYTRTVDSVAALQSTPQTPLFDMDVEGSGELVLTELRRGRARLTLGIQAPGEWTIASIDGGSVALRLVKATGAAEIALEPGLFRLRARTGDVVAEHTVELTDGGSAIVTEADLAHWPASPAGRKGTSATLRMSVVGAVTSAAVSGLGLLGGGGIALAFRRDGAGAIRPLWTASLGLAGGAPPDDAFLERELSLLVGAGVEASFGPVALRAGAEAGGIGVRQGSRSGSVSSFEPRLDAALGGSWTFARPFSLDASVQTGGVLVKTKTRHVEALFAAQAGLGFTW